MSQVLNLNLAALVKRDNSFTYANVLYAVLCLQKYCCIVIYTESFNSKEIIYAGGERHMTVIRLIYM